MALSFGKSSGRTSSAGNPITTASFTIQTNERILVLLIKTVGATNRAGGSPSFGGQTMTQANSTQKAATTPEASAELWYLLDPPTGANTASIPNTGAATIYYNLVTAKTSSSSSGRVALDGANGGNATSTNPTPGAITTTMYNCIGFAVVASGATDFDPATPAGTGFETGTGVPLGTFDDGAHGGGQQYLVTTTPGVSTLSWTFGTSDDWGCVAAFFREIPANRINNFMFTDASSGNTGIISVTEKIR